MLHPINSTTLLAWIVVFLLITGISLAFRRGRSKPIGIVALFVSIGICAYIMYSPILFSMLHHLVVYGK